MTPLGTTFRSRMLCAYGLPYTGRFANLAETPTGIELHGIRRGQSRRQI